VSTQHDSARKPLEFPVCRTTSITTSIVSDFARVDGRRREAQELSTYVEGEVRKLTDDKQLPTFIQSGRLGLRDLEGPLTTITCPRAG